MSRIISSAPISSKAATRCRACALKLGRHHGVDRQQDSRSRRPSPWPRCRAPSPRGRARTGTADLDAARGEEGVGHAAADDQHLHLGDELPSSSSLVDTLAPPTMAATRATRALERRLERFELGLHPSVPHRRQEMGEALVEAWARWAAEKGVVDIGVAALRQRLGELELVFSSPAWKRVFSSRQHLARHERGRRLGGGLADAVRREGPPGGRAIAPGPRRPGAGSPSGRAAFGRPKCASSTTLPPLPAISRMVAGRARCGSCP